MTSFDNLVACIQGLSKRPAEFDVSTRRNFCICIAEFARDYINDTCGIQGPYPKEFANYKKWFPSEDLDSPQSMLLPVLCDYLIPNIPNLHYRAVVALLNKLEILYGYFNRAMIEKIVAENHDVFKIDNTDEFASETAFELSIVSFFGVFKFYVERSDALSIRLDRAISRITKIAAAVRESECPKDQTKKEAAEALLKRLHYDKAAEALLKKLYHDRNKYLDLPKDKRSHEEKKIVKQAISFSHKFKFYFLQCDAFSLCVDQALSRIARVTAAVRRSNYLEDQPKKEAADDLLKNLHRIRNEYVNLPKDKRDNEKKENVKRQMLIIAAETKVDLEIAITSLSSAFKFYSSQCCKAQTKEEAADKLLKELYSARNEYINLTENERTREVQEAVKAEMLTIAFNPKIPFEIAATSLSSAFEFYFPQEDAFTIRSDRAISSIAKATATVRQSNCPEDQLKKESADALLRKLDSAKNEYVNLPEDERTREAQKNTKNKMLDIAFKSKFSFEIAIASLSSAFEFYFIQCDALSICVGNAISRIARATAAVRQSNCLEDKYKKEAADGFLKELYRLKNEYINLPKDERTCEAQKDIKNKMLSIAFKSGLPFEIAVTPLSSAFEFYFSQEDAFTILVDRVISSIAKATSVVRQSNCPEDHPKKEAADGFLKELYRLKNEYINLPKDERTCEAQKTVKNKMLEIALESKVPFEMSIISLSSVFESYFSQQDAFSVQLDHKISIVAKATAAVRQSNRPEDQTKKEAADKLLRELYRAKNKYVNLSKDSHARTCEVQKTVKKEMLGSVSKYSPTLAQYRKSHNSDWHYFRNLIIICVNAIMAITIIPPCVKYKMTDKEVRRVSSAFFSLATKSQQGVDDFRTAVKRIPVRALG